MTRAAVLTAAGSGSRLGRSIPKALVPIGGIPMVTWAASSLATACQRIIVTAPTDFLDDFVTALSRVSADVVVVAGGPTRQRSVAAGLAAMGEDAEAIVVHDAARPFMPAAVMGRALAGLEGADGVIPVVPLVDTVVRIGASVGYLNRAELAAVQTPQAFRAEPLRDAHSRATAESIEATDDGALLSHFGYSVVTCEGDPEGRKITYPEDLEHFERRVSA